MRFIVAGLLVVMSVTAGIAQTNVLRFTDYAMVQPVVNPACMGMEEGVAGLLLYRSRFEKSDYWPSTGVFNINSGIKGKNLGGGINLIYDKYGPYEKLFAYVAGSYKLKVNEGKFLFFGLQAGINYVSNAGNYTRKKSYSVIITVSRTSVSVCTSRPISIMSVCRFRNSGIIQSTKRGKK
jgi:hypothetical protein